MYKAACRKCYFEAMKGRRGEKREHSSEAATTTTVKKKATPLATRTVIGSPTNAKRVAEALAKTVDRFLVANATVECDDQKIKRRLQNIAKMWTTRLHLLRRAAETPSSIMSFSHRASWAKSEKSEENGDEERKRIWWAREKSFDGFMNTSRSPIMTLR